MLKQQLKSGASMSAHRKVSRSGSHSANSQAASAYAIFWWSKYCWLTNPRVLLATMAWATSMASSLSQCTNCIGVQPLWYFHIFQRKRAVAGWWGAKNRLKRASYLPVKRSLLPYRPGAEINVWPNHDQLYYQDWREIAAGIWNYYNQRKQKPSIF